MRIIEEIFYIVWIIFMYELAGFVIEVITGSI